MFKKPFSFKGRIRRLEFGLSIVIGVISIFLLFFLTKINNFLDGILILLIIAWYWFQLSQGTKRCHDIGNNGWCQFIPFYVLWMIFEDSNPGLNKYGKNPKGIGNNEGIFNYVLIKNEKVVKFYKNTIEKWSKGDLDKLNNSFKSVSKLDYENFIKLCGPYEDSMIEFFFLNYDPSNDEYLIDVGEKDAIENKEWFILTNYSLIIRDGLKDEFFLIDLSEIETFILNKDSSNSCIFKMKSGEEIIIDKVEIVPKVDYLNFAIEEAKNKKQ